MPQRYSWKCHEVPNRFLLLLLLTSSAMDHYKVVGLQRNATKEEMKDEFQKLAMRFRPEKHSQASKAVRDDKTFSFK
ncbi:hypothetical protein CRG98_008649 [Punica granatum]|uniref:J domain-containing protein n=1 Tax=Punica granatum TaxID=22663 RepID=A0A2I0KSV1_PUNGR|nr:hypothetical protein CRG98_008649 [Punica granatum]